MPYLVACVAVPPTLLAIAFAGYWSVKSQKAAIRSWAASTDQPSPLTIRRLAWRSVMLFSTPVLLLLAVLILASYLRGTLERFAPIAVIVVGLLAVTAAGYSYGVSKFVPAWVERERDRLADMPSSQDALE